MRKEFEDVNKIRLTINSEEKSISLDFDDVDPAKFVFKNPKEMIEFSASIQIIANRWMNSIPDDIFDSFRSED